MAGSDADVELPAGTVIDLAIEVAAGTLKIRDTLAAAMSFATDLPKPVCEFLAYQALPAIWAGCVGRRIMNGESPR